MKRMLILACLSVSCCWGQTTASDVVLRAMKDEIVRARTLRVVGDPPYFIEYTLDDADMLTVSASYGSILSERANRVRQPRVRVRVGDRKLDNSNHIFSDAYRGSRFDPTQMAIDDNYDVLRLGFWLATDRAYKQALESLARKKAALKNVTSTEMLDDFAEAPAVSLVLPVPARTVDAAVWRKKVARLSAVFSRYPTVLSSEATASFSFTRSYLINNEGTEVRIPDNLVDARVRAAGLAPDGMVVRDYAVFLGSDAGQLPADAELEAAARRVADNVTALAKAPVIDNYSGPVLFEGAAGAQILAELVGRSLPAVRRPVSDPERPLNIPTGELEGRLGSRLLPEWMDAVDDPTQKQWRGLPLFGHYPIDVEGVVPKPLPVFEKGVLKSYFTTRQPVTGGQGPNGHARLPGALGNNTAAAGNLFFQARESATPAALRSRLLDMGKQRSKPWVIIVRKMDFPSSASGDELRRITAGVQGRAVSRPLLVYRVFPDGKEELIRGVRFRGLNVRSLKDIVAASDEQYLFQYLENNGPFVHLDAGGYVAGTSVVSPGLLFDELELERIPGELPKMPLVPPPPLSE